MKLIAEKSATADIGDAGLTLEAASRRRSSSSPNKRFCSAPRQPCRCSNPRPITGSLARLSLWSPQNAAVTVFVSGS